MMLSHRSTRFIRHVTNITTRRRMRLSSSSYSSLSFITTSTTTSTIPTTKNNTCTMNSRRRPYQKLTQRTMSLPSSSSSSSLDDDTHINNTSISDDLTSLFASSSAYSSYPTEEKRRQSERATKEADDDEKRRVVREELKNRKGRLFSDPWEYDEDEMMKKDMKMEDLPDWTEGVVSGLARSMVTVTSDLLPTLAMASSIPLPPPANPHPAYDALTYSKSVRRSERQRLKNSVASLCRRRAAEILQLKTMEERQEAIDELYERVEEEMMEREGVRLGDKKKFGKVVERIVEEYLKTYNYHVREMEEERRVKEEKELLKKMEEGEADDDDDDDNGKGKPERKAKKDPLPLLPLPTTKPDPLPIFIDIHKPLTPDELATFKAAQKAQRKKKPDDDNADSDDDDDSDDEDNERATRAFKAWHTGYDDEIIPHEPSFDWYPVTGPARGIPEEWDLQAHKKTKRIMMRRCIATIAAAVHDSATEKEKKGLNVFVTGREGVGKSAALNAIVAMARRSGYVVLFFPNGDRMTQDGDYIEPSPVEDGVFDLPVLAKDACKQLLMAHESLMEDVVVPTKALEGAFTEKQVRRVLRAYAKKMKKDADSPKDDEEEDEGGGNDEESQQQSEEQEQQQQQQQQPETIPLNHLLTMGANVNALATGCYRLAVTTLTNHPTLNFLMVVDEINCYHDGGQYYHRQWDDTANITIPPSIISLFQPFLNPSPKLRLVKSLSLSRPVPKENTQNLIKAETNDESVVVVDVPRFSDVEVLTMLAHYECVGLGKFRFDGGKSLDNEQEVKYLGMVSGNIGKFLLDASIMD